MPTIITATQLRSVIGVSQDLFDDAYLDQVIDTAEGVILPMLESYSEAVVAYQRGGSVATLFFENGHSFSVGQSVVIAGVGTNYNGTKTITATSPNSISYASAYADQILFNCIPAGSATLSNAATYVGNANVESAVYAVAVEIFQARVASGGSIEGVDFQPSPFRMGKSLMNKVTGLLGDLLDVEAFAQ
jgi:hypothetical protein